MFANFEFEKIKEIQFLQYSVWNKNCDPVIRIPSDMYCEASCAASSSRGGRPQASRREAAPLRPPRARGWSLRGGPRGGTREGTLGKLLRDRCTKTTPSKSHFNPRVFPFVLSCVFEFVGNHKIQELWRTTFGSSVITLNGSDI